MSKIETFLCAVKNPIDPKNNSWFYNVFLGRQRNRKTKHHRNEVKVNWIIPSLTRNEIELLQKKTCKVINLTEGIEIEIIDEENDDIIIFKEGFEILFELFNRFKDKKEVKEEINKLLYDSKGYPSKELEKIYECEKLTKKYDVVINN